MSTAPDEKKEAEIEGELSWSGVKIPDHFHLSWFASVMGCVEINQCAGCTRQFFPKSFLGDGAAVLAPSSGEEPASPRHRAGVASMAWRPNAP